MDIQNSSTFYAQRNKLAKKSHYSNFICKIYKNNIKRNTKVIS